MRVIVGRVGRPHGIRGDLLIGIRTDEPDLRFAVGAVLAADPEPPPDALAGHVPAGEAAEPPGRLRLTVARARWHSGQLLVGFAGVADRTAAGELTGRWLSVAADELPATGDPDEFRDHELVGLAVRTRAGEPVGTVAEVWHHGQDLLVVRGPGGQFLVPFVKAIVPEVDVTGGLLTLDPPAGLLDPAP